MLIILILLYSHNMYFFIKKNIQILLSRPSTGQLSFLVEEVEHAAQYGYEEEADDDDRYDDSTSTSCGKRRNAG